MIDQIHQAVVTHDRALAGHGTRVAGFAEDLGVYMGLDEEYVRRLAQAALLHDVGKVRLSSKVLNKPGALDRLEWDHMRQHPGLGFQIVQQHVEPDIALAILHHHERYDGTGYGRGLAGTNIPLLARILLVADAFDAITSDRPYQPARSSEYALDELRLHAGTQFDPLVVEAILGLTTETAWVTSTLGLAVHAA